MVKTQTAGESIGDCPFPKLLIPEPYFMTTSGIYKKYTSRRAPLKVAYAPVGITAYLKDVETGLKYLALTWKRGEKWITRIVPRGQVVHGYRILKLANFGFPVTSRCAPHLCEFITEIEADNWDQVPHLLITTHLGWQGRKQERGFLAGRLYISPEGQAIPSEMGTPEETMLFFGTDGDLEFFQAFRSAGTFSAWLEAIRPIKSHPKALFCLYASLAAVLLPVVGCSNFIVDLAARTSTGKTILFRAAASVWGNPDEFEPSCVMNSWYGTLAGLRLRASMLSGIPFLLDNSQLATRKEIEKNLWMVADGWEERKVNKRSTRIVTWKTILLSNGEVPILSQIRKASEIRKRVIQLHGAPFGKPTRQSMNLVNGLNDAVQDHFGHAGPRFVQYVLKNRDQWEEWRERFVRSRRSFAELASAAKAGDHLADAMALIELTAMLVDEAMEWAWTYKEAAEQLKSLWPQILAEANAR